MWIEGHITWTQVRVPGEKVCLSSLKQVGSICVSMSGPHNLAQIEAPCNIGKTKFSETHRKQAYFGTSDENVIKHNIKIIFTHSTLHLNKDVIENKKMIEKKLFKISLK